MWVDQRRDDHKPKKKILQLPMLIYKNFAQISKLRSDFSKFSYIKLLMLRLTENGIKISDFFSHIAASNDMQLNLLTQNGSIKSRQKI